MALLIDTGVFIARERGHGAAADIDERLGEEDQAISVITVSELLQGAHRADVRRRLPRQSFVEAQLAGWAVVPITFPVARVHAQTWAALAERGAMIGARDLWIAATALAHGFGVATTNVREFGRIDGLRVVEIVV